MVDLNKTSPAFYLYADMKFVVGLFVDVWMKAEKYLASQCSFLELEVRFSVLLVNSVEPN